MAKPKFLWWKFIVVWVGFLLLHFSYKAFPGAFFRLFAEANETTFLHMKMLFNSYLLVSLVELAVRWKKLASPSTFFYSRSLIAVAYPWLTITMWFIADSLGLKIPVTPWEIIYANILTLLGIYLALRMEEVFEGVTLRPALKGMILLLLATALVSYTAFSFNPPVHFFTTPPF